MAIVPHNIELLKDDDIGDLKYFDELLNQLHMKKLVDQLNDERGNGRDDYPNASMLRTYIVYFLFNYPDIQSLIDELNRNSDLRAVCWLKTKRNRQGHKQNAPSNAAFTRFEKRLQKHSHELEKIFQQLVEDVAELLPDFGEKLAIDGKLLESFARRAPKSQEKDGRRDTDATTTFKNYTVSTDDGEKVTKTYRYFGYRLHLMVDATYELPIRFNVTKAHESEVAQAKDMVTELPHSVKDRAAYLMGDKGYDGQPLQEIIENEGIIPIIDIRNMWKDGEKTKQYKDTDIVYNYKGDIFEYINDSDYVKLPYKGYHKASESLRYEQINGQILYIDRSVEPRVFNKVARDSKKFRRLYNMRTSVERVNSKLDDQYNFDHHSIRGLEKMKLRVLMSLIVMLGKKKLAVKQNISIGKAA